jgi:putative NADH-flavin reductase
MSKKIIVFGASGITGTHIVTQALEQGYFVTAFVRNIVKLQMQNSNLHIVQGDVMNVENVANAILGQDVVICCIGTKPFKNGTVRSDATKVILEAMEKTGVKRFICQTSLGVGDSNISFKQLPFFVRLFIVPLFLNKPIEDHELQEKYIIASKTDWTIVRPAGLYNTALTKKYRHGFSYDDKDITLKISRADVAHFILEQANSDVYKNKVVGVSY